MLDNLIFNLLTIHIFYDFYFQTRLSCNNKIKCSVKGYALWWHVVIAGALSWIAVWSVYGWWLVLSIVASHFVIDWLKSYLQLRYHVYRLDSEGNLVSGNKRRYDLYFFIGDQSMHILMIILFSYLWYKMNGDWQQFHWLHTLLQNHPIRVYTIIALLLVLKPVNILILQILSSCKLDNETISEEHNSFRAGALIGYTERSLILIFVILSQYEAIGFLIAAKSILRFNEASSGNVKSEYVLTGTLLSLIFALILGLCVIKMPIL